MSDGAERTYKAYYLEIGRGKDPGPDLVKRFHGNKPAVKPVSRSRINLKAKNPFLYAVEDRKTHLTGVIVRVGAVSWLAHRAKVHGGLYSGYRSGTESLYTVVRTRSGWTIESEGDAVKY
ncbi:MAG TPA: hypothetical protein VKT77_15590 [Chthonomonadaceae bacterium]|nr:hypothetical protein [Chthonomonadaceae bacterium]